MRQLMGGAAVFALFVLGCKNETMVPVHGRVTLDGQSVEGGAIQFQPLDGNAPTAGAIITNGEYTTNVPPGKMRVEIRASKPVGKRKEFDTPDSRMVDMLAESIPERYNSDSKLTAEITSKMGPLDFELTTPGK